MHEPTAIMIEMSPFERRFGRTAESSARAPGRVNLIGEHIDYNGGSVLPTPLPRQVRVDLAAREDHMVRAASGAPAWSEEPESFELGSESPGRGWLDYVQGVTRTLRESGHETTGFDLNIDSDVPIGSGLASSAALTVALMRALRRRFDLRLDDERIALLAQRVENEFVGANVGIMDPIVSSLGQEGYALWIDTKRRTYRHARIPPSIEIVVVDSGTPHRHAAGRYNVRRSECERARELLEVSHLCDLTSADMHLVSGLPDPLSRRARHVITENERVRKLVEALEGGSLEEAGATLNESHRSLKEDFEASTEALDTLARLLREEEGILGARLTGGGFGGSIVALARAGEGLAAATRAALRYERRSRRGAEVVLPLRPREAGAA